MNRHVLIVTAFVLFVIFSPYAAAQIETSDVVPNSLTDMEGNTQNGLPFNCGQFGNTSTRYQQAYLNSQISGLPVEIKSINFRLSEDRVEVPPVEIPDIQVNMSTTQAQPGNLSATFADNLGPIVTSVYSGPLTISAPACGIGPCPFTIMIPLQTPFMYDPSDGNLIIDIRISSCSIINIQMDASNTSENLEITSRVATGNAGGLGEDSPFGDLVNDTGLVTEFEVTVILPEPASIPTLGEWGMFIAVVVLSIAGVFFLRKRRIAQ